MRNVEKIPAPTRFREDRRMDRKRSRAVKQRDISRKQARKRKSAR